MTAPPNPITASTQAAPQLVDLQETLYRSLNPTRRWLHCARRDWILDALRHYASVDRCRALEVGPGSGVSLPPLPPLYDDVTAIDVDPPSLPHGEPLCEIPPNLHLLADDIT